MKFLKNHPFAVEAHFERSTVLTFAVPKEQLETLIPECLVLDTFKDKWAFIAIAMVQTKHLRPAGMPKILGNNFFLIGYRIFVKYYSSDKKRYRGLYILKSETDKRKMAILGNIFTHYNYTTTDIAINEKSNSMTISSQQSNFNLIIDKNVAEVQLPTQSPFSNWKEARRYAGPLPHTFTYDSEEKSVLIIEGIRTNWEPTPICVTDYRFKFISELNLNSLVLANAFEINNVPYKWKKGKIDQWT